MEGTAPPPTWLEARNAVNKHGAQSIYGRVLTLDEVRTINMIDWIVNGYQERERAKDKHEWVKANEPAHKLLIWARNSALEMGFDCE